jgi:hypothetical protein
MINHDYTDIYTSSAKRHQLYWQSRVNRIKSSLLLAQADCKVEMASPFIAARCSSLFFKRLKNEESKLNKSRLLEL